MNKKVLVAAVAAAMAAPAAFAQSSVTVGGTVNILWDNVKAGGATGGGDGLKSHDRVRDGAGSNIRFTVIEDLGGGTSAFVQVESAVINNSDTRNNAAGAGASTSGWGNRNSGIGIRSKTAGRFLIGVWDVHYDEHYKTDPGWLIVNSGSSTLGLTNTMGAGASNSPQGGGIGGRYSNVIRWDSPVWSGFSVSANYARPTDSAPVNVAGDVRDGKKNRVWSIAPRWEGGGWSVVYSYLQDKDISTNATLSLGAGNLAAGATVSANWKVTSNRIGVRYKFANGLGLGLLWDESKTQNNTTVVAGQMSVKRRVWAIPVTFETGNHHMYGTYTKADDWRGQIGGVDVGAVTNAAAIGTAGAGTINYGAESGATMWAMGYSYKLSQRTNVGVSYNQIRNQALVRYDLFANSTGNAAVGADPKQFAFNIRHTF
jgi:predicted porin